MNEPASTDQLTVVIAARNAEATIARAIRSALSQTGVGACPILLIDHASTDHTVSVARETGGERLTVVKARPELALGAVRQLGLEFVQTPFGIWLDADDEMLPERGCMLLQHILETESDLVYDEVELLAGDSGEFIRHMLIPPFIQTPSDFVRNFERNYIPAPGVPLFRTRCARKIGFDPALTACEDVDFMLRALASGARASCVRRPLYRQYAYSDSLSRRRDHQREQNLIILEKHDYEFVKQCYLDAGFDEVIALWGVHSMAVFRRDYLVALKFVEEVERSNSSFQRIHEPEGPNPMPEDWRIGFAKGTLNLLIDGGELDEAIMSLRETINIDERPDALNNLGVALRISGNERQAQDAFSRALAIFPNYLDAKLNIGNQESEAITIHPLRFFAVRSEY